MVKRAARRQPSSESSRKAQVLIKRSFSEARRTYHLRADVVAHPPDEEFTCSDYPAMRLEWPEIVNRLLRIPGVKEVSLHKKAIEISIAKAFSWQEIQPRIIRTLHQTYWSSELQILVMQEVSDPSSPSGVSLQEVQQGITPRWTHRILLDESSGTYHLTVPLARAVSWNTDGKGLSNPPGHLKRFIKTILALPGVTQARGSPYEISVSQGAVASKEAAQDAVIEILKSLFRDSASVVVERASRSDRAPAAKADTDSGVRWRVDLTSRMMVEPCDHWTERYHFGRTLCSWKSLFDRLEELSGWLQEPVQQLFDIPGVSGINTDTDSVTVSIAPGSLVKGSTRCPPYPQRACLSSRPSRLQKETYLGQ